MPRRLLALTILALLLTTQGASAADQTAKGAKEALQAFNDMIGPWRATGTPEGTRDEKQKGFWQESISWEWSFKGKDAYLKLAFDKGKYFRGGELRYLADKDQFELTLRTLADEKQSFVGSLQDRYLTVDREDAATGDVQRLVFSLLHANRFLYRYEVKPAGKTLWARRYQVGAIKDGVPFAEGDGKPECVVSGGLGTTQVMYKGKTYYVCCSGCRDAFNDEPEKYIKEFEAKKAAKEKGR